MHMMTCQILVLGQNTIGVTTNQASTSHQKAAPAGNDDVQVVQSSFKQVQGATANQIQYNPRSSVQHVQ